MDTVEASGGMSELRHGDCLLEMAMLPQASIDLILCDPPYGVTGMPWDTPIDLPALWMQFERLAKPTTPIVFFATQPFTTDLINSNRKLFKYNLVWKKNVPTGMSLAKNRPMKYHEDIVVFYKKPPTYNPILKPRVGKSKDCYNYDHYCGPSNHVQYAKVKKRYDPQWVQPSSILEFPVVPNRKGKRHPTEKPVALLEYLIRTYSNPGDMVLDCCMGAGSTGEAAQNTQRNFIGIEHDDKFFLESLNRLKGGATP